MNKINKTDVANAITMLDMSRKQFIALCEEWITEENKGVLFDCAPLECPLHLWVVYNKKKCRQEMVGNTAICPLCDNPMCPDCNNHKVSQLSRVTGYLSRVDDWGAAKAQEFKDRQRHNIG